MSIGTKIVLVLIVFVVCWLLFMKFFYKNVVIPIAPLVIKAL